MTEHLSDLVLDEIESGFLRAGPALEHLGYCSACRARLEAARNASREARANPAFRQVLAQVQQRAKAPQRRTWLWALIPAVACAGIALAVLLPRPTETERLKGAPFLHLLRADHSPVQSTLHPGDRVALALGAAGHRYALVFSIGDNREVSLLWPAGASQSGQIHGSAAVLGQFEVTAGSASLLALLSDEPLSWADVAPSLRAAVEQAVRKGERLSSLEPPTQLGERGRARARLEVEP